MFTALLDRMATTPRTTSRTEVMRASSSDSVLSAITVDASSNVLSSSSTPPTSIGDSASITSSSMKLENVEPASADVPGGRVRRARTSVGTYNVKVLAGTSIHAPKKYSKDPDVIEARRRKLLGETIEGTPHAAESQGEAAGENADNLDNGGTIALDVRAPVEKAPRTRKRLSLGDSPKKTAKQRDLARRKSMRSPKNEIESISKRMSLLGKRDRKIFEEDLAGLAKAKRELKNLADTPEFAKIELKPVIHEVWSNGKLVKEERPKKKKKTMTEEAPSPKSKAKETKEKNEPSVEKEPDEPKSFVRKPKTYLTKGLYAGQETRNLDWFAHDSGEFRKKMDDVAPYRPNTFMPLPMWHGQRLLQVGRHFQLPFDVCSPLPPGQPKPDEWRKTSSNRFVGDAKELWKKSKWTESASSKCICTSASGCDEDCQNRIMLYECDDSNCGAGRAQCTNRSFADLAERRKLGGKYRIGVEVVKTVDRGYGVRSNRCFEANQIIVEYTGEIITEDECDRRMNEDYKSNDCYYLMSFDQGMILDGTKGSIARFINHSCKPNCKMVKWYVGGKPRMALFAGDNPIMTGDELTYDYNFDPFSAKNVQECRCGSDNCRGILGPRPKDLKPLKETIKEAMKAGVKAGKRKLKELLVGSETDEEDGDVPSPKKRKAKETKGLKRGASKLKKAKGAANIVKKTVSSQLFKTSRTVSTKRGAIVVKKTIGKKIIKTYGKSQSKSTFSKGSTTGVKSKASVKISKKSSGVSKNTVRKNTSKNMRGIPKGSRGPCPEGTIEVISNPGGHFEDEDDDMYEDEDDEE